MLHKDVKDSLLRRLKQCGDSLRKKGSVSNVETEATPTSQHNIVECFTNFDSHFYIFNEAVRNQRPLPFKRNIASELITLAHSTSALQSRRSSKERIHTVTQSSLHKTLFNKSAKSLKALVRVNSNAKIGQQRPYLKSSRSEMSFQKKQNNHLTISTLRKKSYSKLKQIRI